MPRLAAAALHTPAAVSVGPLALKALEAAAPVTKIASTTRTTRTMNTLSNLRGHSGNNVCVIAVVSECDSGSQGALVRATARDNALSQSSDSAEFAVGSAAGLLNLFSAGTPQDLQ